MKKKTIYALGSVASGISGLALLWWGCWFLRLGPNGPNGWAFFPVTLSALVALAATLALGFCASEEP